MGRSLQIVELAVVHGPDEGPDRGAQKKDRQGDQHEDDVHGRPPSETRMRFKRNAFTVTSSELSDIPMAAIQGINTPLTASGIAVAL